MIIIVTGMPGSGKSTLVNRLAKEFGLKAVFASDILKALKDKGIKEIDSSKTKMGEGWWESKEGVEYNRQRLKDMSMDEALDRELLRIISKGNVVVDSRTMAWLSDKGIKIWLEVSLKERARRIAERDKKPVGRLIENMKERAEGDKKIYKKLYGFDFGRDFKPFHLVLNTDNLNADEVYEVVSKKIKTIVAPKYRKAAKKRTKVMTKSRKNRRNVRG